MKALVLGGTHDHIALIAALRLRGYSCILVDYLNNPPAKQFADKHIRESTLDKDKVLTIAKQEAVDLVITACIDQALLTMCYVAECLNLPAPFSYEVALNVTNKSRMKQILLEHEIKTAAYSIYSDGHFSSALDGKNYPMIVKPADCNGSLAVSRVENIQELNAALGLAVRASRSQTAIVEEFIDGIEYSVDCYVVNGKAHLIMTSESRKISGQHDNFPIVQSRFPANITLTTRNQFQKVADAVTKAFKLENCPLLLQFLGAEDSTTLIEFGARIGGGSKIHFLRHITGLDITELAVALLFKEPFRAEVKYNNMHYATTYVYGSPGVISSVHTENLNNSDSVVESFLYKAPGDSIASHHSSRDRLMSFISTADSESSLEKEITRALKQIEIKSTEGKDLVLRDIYG